MSNISYSFLIVKTGNQKIIANRISHLLPVDKSILETRDINSRHFIETNNLYFDHLEKLVSY